MRSLLTTWFTQKENKYTTQDFSPVIISLKHLSPATTQSFTLFFNLCKQYRWRSMLVMEDAHFAGSKPSKRGGRPWTYI
jgi:hypothetical protein